MRSNFRTAMPITLINWLTLQMALVLLRTDTVRAIGKAFAASYM